jgi:glycosyltransferase involved in cell wall biosynthesis
MKILLCKSHFAGPVSGSDETLVAYATHLHKEGHQLCVVLLYPPSNADQYYVRLKQAGVEVTTITSYPLAHIFLCSIRTLAFRLSRFFHLPTESLHRSRKIWQRVSQWVALIYLRSCRAYFQRSPADLIHVLTPHPGSAVMIRAGVAAGIPAFYQELGTPRYLPGLELHYEWFARVLPLCAEVAALSPRLAQQWRGKLFAAKPISVLPLLVEDTHRAQPAEAKPAAAVTFGFAARMESGKGPMILVEAFAQVRLELADISLKMAGVGPQMQAVKAWAKTLGVRAACAFPGLYTAPADRSTFMQSLDVFVLPTLAEGTPNSIIEAMAHGLPVIASAVGGIPDLVTPETGVLVAPGDTAALANAMLMLASDPERRARMGRAARARYEQLFSPQAVLPTLLDVYRRIATRNGNGSAAPPTQRRTHPWIEAAQE